MPAKTLFTKEAVIETAFSIACEEGLEHMTIRSIAKKMGSSIAPIYVNFDNTEDLKKAVLHKAYDIFHEMIESSEHDDLFLRYGIASISFSKKYPRLYDAFLLGEDHPSETQKNVEGMLYTLRKNPTYEKLDTPSLIFFIMSMQALQVGLSIMARKSYYQPYLHVEDMISLLDKTGSTLIENLIKEKTGHDHENI